MPELPDLQALSHHLSKKLIGKQVEKTHATETKKMKTLGRKLNTALKGAKVSSLYRDGKELHISFSNGRRISMHLMLKGQLHFVKDGLTPKFPILQIWFSDGTGLVMTDFQRQATASLDPETRTAPDALSKEAGYVFLRERLSASKSTVKKLLMDQHVVRGIGNAYADEILWHARISPFSVCNKIPDSAVRRLSRSIRTVLQKAEKTILKKDPEGIYGENREFLLIHNPDRTESPTGAPIRIDHSGARKTYYTDEQELFK